MTPGCKLKREALRLLKNAVRDYPGMFARNFREKTMESWNDWQRREEAGQKHYRHCELPQLKDGLTLLDLDFLSGFGETVHPDVLYAPNGWFRAGWRYLMALTPLPHGAEYFENPEFIVSADGLDWHLPEGGRSPVVPAPGKWLGFNSDPSLMLVGDKLYLYYRDIREYAKNDVEVRVLLTTTSDGVNWTEPVSVISQHHDRKYPALLMSMSILDINGSYYMWYVSADHGEFRIFRRQSRDLYGWTEPSITVISGLEANEYPWHLDVVKDNNDELLMVLCTSNSEHFRRKSLCFARSRDKGLSWNVGGPLLRPGWHGFGEASLYRAALVKNGAGGMWRLYYSGQDMDKHWRTVATDIELWWNNLGKQQSLV